METLNQQIVLPSSNISLCIKRDDLIHPFVSGNKFRKLKYNLFQAQQSNYDTLLTFGGAFSNHIAAVAAAGKIANFKTVGIIRGEELEAKVNENPTLKFAESCGMQLDFVSRETYRKKSETSFIQRLTQKWGDFYALPEGGTNDLAVRGCEEILRKEDAVFDYICCSVGTGGTISGLINSAGQHQKVLGFPALKGMFLREEICRFAQQNDWDLILDYHFGGYGKVNLELIQFINQFYKMQHIPLDPIYTGKMVFGVIDLIKKNYFPEGSKILMIHTGGLQGIEGMNLKLKKIKSPLIDYP
ncbi:MAG: 1-aminocyclopropane-1-carboxylate deaminase/D-cysteine desulfhydrase [Burkholderiales bacterium]|nr:1-aminocyclopropane-1-carboxylate deaminase/D-cysteine desulfhydrase [Flavobacterium sp.]